MIRPLTIVTFLMACGSGLYLYQSKHEAQVLDRTIEKSVRETASFRDQSRMLAAEWTMLNDPERLRQFADTYLALKTITPAQFSSVTDLDNRLPPVQVTLPPDISVDPAVPIADPPDAQPFATATVVPVAATPGDGPATATAGTGAQAPAAPASAVARGAERKVALARPADADATARAASSEQSVRSLAADTAPAPRPAAVGPDARIAEQRAIEPRGADRRVSPLIDPRVADPRVADNRAPVPPPMPRPTVIASESRAPVTGSVLAQAANLGPMASAPLGRSHLPAPTPALPAAATPHSGSLLGMARGVAPQQLPHPTPVNATRFDSTN